MNRRVNSLRTGQASQMKLRYSLLTHMDWPRGLPEIGEAAQVLWRERICRGGSRDQDSRQSVEEIANTVQQFLKEITQGLRSPP